MSGRILFIVFAAAIALASCKTSNNSKCPDRVCDASFGAISIRFLDKDGDGMIVKKFSAVNLRTNDTIKSNFGAFADVVPGTYFVVDDSYIKKLSETGDDIKISATDTTGNILKMAIIKVSGGECACHVKKVSGPDTIQFD